MTLEYREQDGFGLFWDPADPRSVAYVPVRVRPDRFDNGAPAANFIEAGPMAILQLGANIGVDQVALEALPITIAAALDDVDPSQIELSEVPISVAEARLELVDETGEAKTLASSSSSGMPPFSAAFNASLMGPDIDTVKKAIAGDGGALRVVYDVEVGLPGWATATVSGEIDPGASADPVAAALGSGALRETTHAGGAAETADADAAKAREAAGVVAESLSGGLPGDTEVGVTSTSTTVSRTAHAMTLSADATDWFRGR